MKNWITILITLLISLTLTFPAYAQKKAKNKIPLQTTPRMQYMGKFDAGVPNPSFRAYCTINPLAVFPRQALQVCHVSSQVFSLNDTWVGIPLGYQNQRPCKCRFACPQMG